MTLKSGVISKGETFSAIAKLCEGMTCRIWAWLCRYDELCNNIYVVKSSPTSARKVDEFDSLPWTIIFLLGSHSKKHVFLQKRALDLSIFHEATFNMMHKLKWAWSFRNNPRQMAYRQLCSRNPVPDRGRSCPEIEAFSSGLKRVILRVNKQMYKFSPNISGFVVHALKFAKQYRRHFVRGDKDGVFASFLMSCTFHCLHSR